jgi:hypothetical protein
MLLAPGHHEALLFKHQTKLNFKSSKKYLDIANCIHYGCAIFQYEIPCHVGSAKKIKWSKFERKKICTVHASRSSFLLFLPRTQYNVFWIKILYNHSAWSYPQIGIFFKKWNLKFFHVQKNGLHWAHPPPKRCSR